MTRRPAPQDRNTLLWSVGCFAALQLALAVAIEWRLPLLRDPEFVVKAQRLRARVTRGRDRPFTVVMLGSSRTDFAFEAARVEGPLATALGRPAVVFNLGLRAAGPISHLVYLRRLLADGIRPDLLLVEVLPPFLSVRGQSGEVTRLPAHKLWHRDLAVVSRYPSVFPNHCADWWQAFAVPWYAHRFLILNRALPALLPYSLRDCPPPIDDSGWAGGTRLTTMTRAGRGAALARAQEGWTKLLEGFQLGGAGAQALEDLLRVCQREGIPAALALLPEGTEFRGWYSAAAWGQIQGYLGELNRRYGAPVIDTRTWLPDEAFLDSHHVLLGGAAAFTTRFGREAVIPLARSVLHFRAEGRGQHAAGEWPTAAQGQELQ